MPQFEVDFRPILQQGQTARLYKADTTLDVVVDAVQALPVHRHDFGALTTTATNQDDVHIDVGTMELAQYRFIIWGEFEVEMKHPGTSVQYWTARGGTAVNFRMVPWVLQDPGMDSPYSRFLWQASEFFVFEDETPRFDLYPMSSASNVQAHMSFHGWLFKLSLLPRGERPVAHIRVNGWPSP